jgi:nucleoid DNA-binding protein
MQSLQERTHLKGNQMAKKQEYGKALSKTETLTLLAEKTNLSKKEVGSVIDALGDIITDQLSKKGPGVFNVPGLMKVKVVRKPATPARKGINPFTKEEQMFKAKPARNVVKIAPLKALKDSV